jgi:hypothetical protein
MKNFTVIQKRLSGVCFFLFIILFTNANAQLTGYKTIDNTGSGDYISFAAAIADLNNQGVGPGGVGFYAKADQTFIEPPLVITASGTQNNPIVFGKSGKGANPKIYGLGGTISPSTVKENGDAVIKVIGGDFIRFTEINFYDSPSNTNNTSRMEYGILFVRRDSDTNACKNISVQYCEFVMNSSNPYTIGIYNSNLTASGSLINPIFEDTDTNKRCVNFSIQNNSINNCNFGIASIGISDNSPYSLYDQNISINNNDITSIGGHYNISCYGMDLRWMNEITINGNSVSGGQGTTGNTGNIIGIHTFAYDANSEISNNTISVGSSTQNYGLIYAIYSGANGETKIHNNEVKNCYGTGQLFAAGGMAMIYHYASNTNRIMVYENNIHDNSIGGYSYHTNIIWVNTLDLDSCNIYGNNIYNNISSSEGLATMTGIIGVNAHHNNIYDNYAGEGVVGISANTDWADGETYGNIIHDNGSGIGIIGEGNIYDNRIYNLRTTENRTVYGIYINGGDANIYNNSISGLLANNANSPVAVCGIFLRLEGTIKMYSNTIFLANYSNLINTGSACIYESASYDDSYANIEMKNNILVNISEPGLGGSTIAFGRSNDVLTGYSPASDNNCYYSTGYIYKGKNQGDFSISDFKNRVEPSDKNSFVENPPFVDPWENNLHIRTDVITRTESGGVPVTYPVNITHDIDGDVRNTVTPDIGADEFTGIGIEKDVEVSETGQSGIKYFEGLLINNFTTKVRNNGAETVSFKVFRRITPGAYYDSLNINNLTARKDTMVQFASFNFDDGTQYRVKDSVYLSGDQIPDNNLASSIFLPAKAKSFVVVWGDTQNRDKLLNTIYNDGRFVNDFDTVNMNTFKGSLHPWKTVFALYGDFFQGEEKWTPKMRDTMKSFLDHSTPGNKKTLLIFGNNLGRNHDGGDPQMTEADSVFYRHYLKANYLQTTWGYGQKGEHNPFWDSEQRIRGLGNFSSIDNDTAEINGTYSDLITPVNGGSAAIIPYTESGNGDSCVAVFYGGNTTPYNVLYCSIEFKFFKEPSGDPGMRIAGNSIDGIGGTSILNVFDAIANWVQLPEIGGNGAMPVELASFSSLALKNEVILDWSTISELNNKGFEVMRSNDKVSWSSLAFVNGAGTVNSIRAYKYADKNLLTGKYYYRLKQVDYNGNFKYYNLVNEVNVGVPGKFALGQNYPNPFNPSTKINYEIPFDSKVSIKIFDITGREMYQLVNESQAAGYYTAQFNAVNLASGVYFYMINANGGNQSFIKTMKMVLVK